MLLNRRVLLPMFVLAWAALIACASRPAPVASATSQLDQPSADSSQQLPPFHSGGTGDNGATANATEAKGAARSEATEQPRNDGNDAKKDSKIVTGSVLPPQKVPAGTPIAITLQSSISSATAVSGQTFEAVLDQPLVADGVTLAPKGTPVTGRVISARKSGHLHKPGYLRLTLVSMTLHGQVAPIETSTIFVQGGSHEKRNLAFMGGGAAGGALIGALAGGGKGALIGSMLGAGGGAAGAYATGPKDVNFNAERRLTFRLAHEVSVSS
jgi:hypothetical protein